MSCMGVHQLMTAGDIEPLYVEDIPHRAIITVHVRSVLHQSLFCARNILLQSMPSGVTSDRRLNFHVSIDQAAFFSNFTGEEFVKHAVGQSSMVDLGRLGMGIDPRFRNGHRARPSARRLPHLVQPCPAHGGGRTRIRAAFGSISGISLHRDGGGGRRLAGGPQTSPGLRRNKCRSPHRWRARIRRRTCCLPTPRPRTRRPPPPSKLPLQF